MSEDIPYCISGGIGDLFITRVLFDHNEIEEPVCISEYELMYFRGNSKYAALFSYDLAQILFRDVKYIEGENYKKKHYQSSHWFKSKPINVKQHFNIHSEKTNDIVIHTKVRADRDKDKQSMIISLLLAFCKTHKFNCDNIILIGERELSDNIETHQHGQYSVYKELMALGANNSVIDLTQKELYNVPDYKQWRRDIEYIASAKHVISLGWGGNYALTWGFADNYTAWIGSEPHNFLHHMELHSTQKRKNIRNFTDFIHEIKQL